MAKKYGLICRFDKTGDIMHAAEKVNDLGFKKWDTFAPFLVHGLDKAMGMSRSKVPIFTFCGGFTGFCTGTLITWFMNGFDYPLIVGGKPFWSPIFPFPVMYELTILFAAFGTLAGMFIMNLLPRHHHPLFDYEQFAQAGDDKFLLFIECADPKFDEEGTRKLMEELGGQDITLVHEK